MGSKRVNRLCCAGRSRDLAVASSLSVRWSRYCRASRPVQARRRGPGRFLEFFAFDLQLRAARHLCKSGEMALGALPLQTPDRTS